MAVGLTVAEQKVQGSSSMDERSRLKKCEQNTRGLSVNCYRMGPYLVPSEVLCGSKSGQLPDVA